ncbi:MAG: aldolase/citrate lyase family protein [Candidatus Sphingomonas phytovorans]|nr:aldolase/citrate lyase family protein [Sphingomonas sp.]WEK02318.1 MAG: aldolase/citrate lyase family protein [Sphingomonas sp.]
MRYDRERSIDLETPVMVRLAAGHRILSLGIRYSRTPDIARMASGAGYDLVWIDLEHSSISIDAASQIAATAHDIGLGAWVRVPEREYGVIGRLLDSGATGIIGPKIENDAEARLLAAACRFPPVGKRSMLARLPQTGFVRTPADEFVTTANRSITVQALIESPLGVENADAIAAVEGIDIVAVGTNDLTAEMGCPGKVRDPAVMQACERVAAAARKHGKVAIIGGVADDDHFLALLDMGFAPFIFAGIDTDVVAEGLTQRADSWRRKFA